MISRDAIVNYLNLYLENNSIKDSSSNGLQVSGAETVSKIGLAVDASLETYKRAVAAGCQMLIVHHGLIWDGLKYITGTNYDHLTYLINNRLNLFASHLPLDRHDKVGNNVLLARSLGLINIKRSFTYDGVDIGYCGELKTGQSAQQIASILAKRIGGNQVVLPFGKRLNKMVGIVSGGAPEMLTQAIDQDLDCFVTGESSHQNHHQAKEAGINVVYGGHYHTETYGVKAVGTLLTEKFKVKTLFIDVPTIV